MENIDKYIDLQIQDEEFATQIRQALEQIISTPEGLEAIKQAYERWGTKIKFTDYDEYLPNKNLAKTGASITEANINIIRTDLLSLAYSNAETGNAEPYSIQRSLFHEIIHAGDPLYSVDEMEEAWAKRTDVNSTYINWRAALEDKAISATNAFMEKYYGEAHRDLNYEIVLYLDPPLETPVLHTELTQKTEPNIVTEAAPLNTENDKPATPDFIP